MSDDDRLREQVERQSRHWRKADRERHSLLAETVYVGGLGLMFVLPVVAGAYLGRWLDERLAGYSLHWTLSLLLVGVAVGAYSVYRTIRD